MKVSHISIDHHFLKIIFFSSEMNHVTENFFIIYMTETKCGPLTNKRKVESWNKNFFSHVMKTFLLYI